MKCPICGSENMDFVAEQNSKISAPVISAEEVEGKTHIKVGEYKAVNNPKNYFECKDCGKRIVILDTVIDGKEKEEEKA